MRIIGAMLLAPIGELMLPTTRGLYDSLLSDILITDVDAHLEHLYDIEAPRSIQPRSQSRLSLLLSRVATLQPGTTNITAYLGTKEVLRLIFAHIAANGGPDLVAMCSSNLLHSRDAVIDRFHSRYRRYLHSPLSDTQVALIPFGRDFRLSYNGRSAIRLVQSLVVRDMNSVVDRTVFYGPSEGCELCCCILTLSCIALLSTFLPVPLH